MSPALLAVRQAIAHWQERAAAQGGVLRQPPPEPESCCGRGCQGCVWEGFYAAAAWWVEDAEAVLSSAPGCQAQRR